MGRVWLGRHVKLGRLAAIKVLKAEHIQNTELVGRFFDEARAVNQVNHEHIVAISDFVEERERSRVYCIMEYLRGESLERRLSHEALPLDEVRSVVRQVCEALSAAHELGIVHRDIKPDNIFLSKKGDGSLFAKVLDFGVAKLSPKLKRAKTTTTQSGRLVGTPAYMAPEQLAGAEIDASADVYAVGTLLYRLLAGSLPFVEEDVGKLTLQVIKEPAPPLPLKTTLSEPIPRAISRIVMRALAKEAPDRPRLEEVIAALSATAAEPEPRRWPIAALAAALLVVAGFVAYRLMPGSSRAPQAELPTPPPPPLLPQTVTLTVRTEPPGALVTRSDTGEALGRTPLTREVEVSSHTVELTLTREGYVDARRTVTLAANAELDLALQAKAPPLPSVKSGKKAKKMRLSDEGTLDPFSP